MGAAKFHALYLPATLLGTVDLQQLSKGFK